MPLFRPESLRGQDTLHGEVSLVPPVSWQVLGVFLFAATAAGLIFVATARYDKVAVVRGVVAPSPAGVEAALSVPQSAIGLIAPGQPVRIAVDAFPYQVYGALEGRVTAVAPAADPGQAFAARATLPATVWAYGSPRPLRPGMTLTARIRTRPRTLLAWLFDPVLAVRRPPA
jgi:membrane fusion protein